jgi:hypothetical protein
LIQSGQPDVKFLQKRDPGGTAPSLSLASAGLGLFSRGTVAQTRLRMPLAKRDRTVAACASNGPLPQVGKTTPCQRRERYFYARATAKPFSPAATRIPDRYHISLRA